MDITLERIISLIPQTADGKFVHGEQAAFARKFGFKDGQIVNEWIKGRSVSYRKYLFDIAEAYHVSVEWLRGETDKKGQTAAEAGEGLSARDMALLNWFRSLPREKQQAILIAQDAPKDIL